MEELSIRPFTPVSVSQEADLGIPAEGDSVTRHYKALLSHLQMDLSIMATRCAVVARESTATREDVRRVQQVRDLIANASKVLWV